MPVAAADHLSENQNSADLSARGAAPAQVLCGPLAGPDQSRAEQQNEQEHRQGAARRRAHPGGAGVRNHRANDPSAFQHR